MASKFCELKNPGIGRGGFISPEHKREGDGCTPLGEYPLREIWYRPDRIAKPTSGLPVHAITVDDCWCDDPCHLFYNKHFKLGCGGTPIWAGPHQLSNDLQASQRKLTSPLKGEVTPASFEHLWREDHAYDLIVVIGYNDAPPIPGKGSAIFIHCMHDDGRPTAGCVALTKPDLLAVVSQLTAASRIIITREIISIV